MRVGDIIPLQIPEVITAMIDEVPLMECRYGQQGGQFAIKIERFITSEQPDFAAGEKHG